jgi:hypothetical protein
MRRLSSGPFVLPLLVALACEADESSSEHRPDAAVSPPSDAGSARSDTARSTHDASAATSRADAASSGVLPGSSGEATTGAGSNADTIVTDEATNPDVTSDETSNDSVGAATGADADAGDPANGACQANALRCRDDSNPEICDADQIWRPLAACAEPLRCVAGQCVAGLDNVCPLLPALPRFTGTQVVDGDDAEFSDVPAVTYALAEAPVVNPSYSASLSTEVTIRMAWTPSALVAHVHVTDPAVQTYQGEILEYYWQGDNVQFFIAPTDLLTGKYSGTEDSGATHLVIVPPAGGQPSRAIAVYEPCYACVDATVSAVSYAARVTADGYDVELAWPWAGPNGALGAGARVSLNLIVGASDTPSTGLELEGLLANNSVAGETPCGGATHPGCDDRTWCYATLE